MKSHDRLVKGLTAIFGINFSQFEKIIIKSSISFINVEIVTYPQKSRYPTFKSHDVAAKLLALADEPLDRDITHIKFELRADDFPRVTVERLIVDKV